MSEIRSERLGPAMPVVLDELHAHSTAQLADPAAVRKAAEVKTAEQRLAEAERETLGEH